MYEQFSALFQDFAKFERGAGENITYGKGEAFQDAKDFDNVVASLGRRFEGGRQLSIGQWQRLATARALYKKPKLLVLDEPTASVDAISEQAMFEALEKIRYDLTILLVAHRFATISYAKHIIVLDKGKVVGVGDHDYLIKTCQFYADMFSAQHDY